MTNTIRSKPVTIFYLFMGLSLAIVFILVAANPARANPGILYTAPAVQGSGNCSSWGNACSLQTALSVSVSGDEIWVKVGVHYPGINREDSFTLKNGVALYGGFAGNETGRDQRSWQNNVTVLSGDIDKNDATDPNGVVTDPLNIAGNNSYHVVNGGATGSTAKLDGFIITAGQANGGGSYNNGGGMFNDSNSSPVLTNVTFSGNTASGSGGGMYNTNSQPALIDAAFIRNTAQANGGGMFNIYSSNPALINVAFRANSASGGGGMYNHESSAPTLTNVVFSNQTASWGGGMVNDSGSNVTLTNVTFGGNTATGGAGGIYNYNSNPASKNVILWGNTAPTGAGIYNTGSSTPVIAYSDIQGCGGTGGGWVSACAIDGGGNRDADPLFLDIAGGNLRLLPHSPVIDAGDNAAVPAGISTDLNGHPRFVDVPTVPDTGFGTPPIVDMGAYEVMDKFVYLPAIFRHN